MNALKVFLWVALMLIIVGFIGLAVSYSIYSISASALSTSLTSTTSTPDFKPDASPNPLWPKAGHKWTNSLNVLMVPAGTDGVLFSVYDVRLKDFQDFAKETNLPVSSEYMNTYKVIPHANGDGGATAEFGEDSSLSWQNPGFYQGPTEPVVGISWNETQLFCQWLTQKERAANLIGPDQEYRLPHLAEWNRAAGDTEYPWGNRWPPHADDGNYCDLTWQKDTRHYVWRTILNKVSDGYAFTNPVDAFPPNNFGLYDMGGNVCQFSDEPDQRTAGHKFWRGSSWSMFTQDDLRTESTHYSSGTSYRNTVLGFRVVLDTTGNN